MIDFNKYYLGQTVEARNKASSWRKATIIEIDAGDSKLPWLVVFETGIKRPDDMTDSEFANHVMNIHPTADFSWCSDDRVRSLVFVIEEEPLLEDCV